MTGIKKFCIGFIGCSLLAASVRAIDPVVLDRAFIYGAGAAQRPDSTDLVTDYPIISDGVLVNLAMGRDVDVTNTPNQVLALTFACDLSSASLVVYDQAATNTLQTVAVSSSLYFADSFTTNGLTIQPNGRTNDLARFVTMMEVQNSNSGTNALLGGFLTIAGRLHRDPVTGCPLAVALSFDKNSFDKTYDLKKVKLEKSIYTLKVNTRVGLANVMGGVEFVQDGVTNNLMLPLANMDIRYALPTGP